MCLHCLCTLKELQKSPKRHQKLSARRIVEWSVKRQNLFDPELGVILSGVEGRGGVILSQRNENNS